jgi:DNA-directed RNA polymerase beta subunit
VLLSHGVTEVINEALHTSSDAYVFEVCDHCGQFLSRDESNGHLSCKACETNGIPSNDISASNIMMPYGAKLLFQELTSMMVRPQLIVKNGTQFRGTLGQFKERK